MSDYLEGALSAADRRAMELHLDSCRLCTDLLAGMSEVLGWGKHFPVYTPPAWLATRIVANTPVVVRETWRDTLTGMWQWLVEPRTAMAIFTSVLVIGWLGGIAGISPAAVMRNPAAVYYQAGGLVNRAYDQAIRTYYQSRIVTEIYCRIEQFRENS
jgi:hypothetical protein